MSRVLQAIGRTPWAITPEGLHTIIEVASRHGDLEAVEAQLGRELENTRTVTVRDGVAIIPVTGPLFRYANLFTRFSGGTSYQVLATDFHTALNNPAVRAILFVFDSPGGELKGMRETSEMFFAARGKKPMSAYVDAWAASAAYGLAAAVGEIVVDETAFLGSIGVIAQYTDTSVADEKAGIREIEIISSVSPKKAPDPAEDSGRAQIQEWIDQLGEIFVANVGRYRGKTRDEVIAMGGEGNMRIGAAAVEAGLADRVGSFEAVLADLAARGSRFRAGTPAGTQVRGGIMPDTNASPAAEQTTPVLITRDHLIANHADLVAGFRAEGAQSERERILGIEALSIKGHEKLIDELKQDPSVSVAGAQIRLIQAVQKEGAQALERIAGAEAQTNVPAAPVNAVTTKTEEQERAEKVQRITSAGKPQKQN